MKSSTSWVKGQSGNPAGKPRREKTISSVLRAKLDTEAFVDRLIALAKGGDDIDAQTSLGAMRMILNYCDGLPIARAEVDPGEGLLINVTYTHTEQRNYHVENNRIELTGAPSSPTTRSGAAQALYDPRMRAPLRKDDTGDERNSSSGPKRIASGRGSVPAIA